MPFAPIAEILRDLRSGKMIILTDGRSPDSVGDLVCAAEKVRPEVLNFMARHARGLIRLSLPAGRCRELQLEVQSTEASLPLQKAFTISIDARNLVGPGVSIRNRVRTILTAVDERCGPSDLVRPGHVLPLRARDGGVLVRAGKTEGSVDLARLAGLRPGGVLCEILDTAGDPMRLGALKRFCGQHRLRMATLDDVIEFRLAHEPVIERVEEVELPTLFGDFRLIAFRNMSDPEPHLALCRGDVGMINRFGRVTPDPGPVLVRVQPDCLPGCALNSGLCDCGELLRLALRRIGREGKGALVLLRQHQGERAEQAIHPHALGKAASAASVPTRASETERRDFGLGAQILRALGLRKLRVLTNSRRTIYGLEGFGLSVVEQIPLRRTRPAPRETGGDR